MDVAIYLRKSRDESDKDDVLSKHRDTLVNIANERGWKYTLYEEIASGERIAYRPVMQDMLETVENGTYDAILVMDIDRLGRGNNKDWGVIYEAFCNDNHNTLIVTPQRTYDLSVDTDEMMVDFQSLFAKMEYKQIKKRMMRGKIAGAKRGQWVCGKPPYPYIKKDGQIIVDEEKGKVYRMVVDMALSGTSLEQLAIYLNANQIKTPAGAIPQGTSGWNYQQVRRLLSDETHLGYIIYGKSKGDPRKGNYSKLPRDKWIVTEGSHPPLKTEEEHKKILALIASRCNTPVAARAGKYVLSGLLVCKKCGYTMRFTTTRGKYKCVQCNHRFVSGERCTQRGSSLAEPFLSCIIDRLFTIDESRLASLREKNQTNKATEKLISSKEKEIVKIDKAITRLYELYEEGEISKADFVSRKSIRAKQKEALTQAITNLKASIVPAETEKDFMRKINFIKKNWRTTTTTKEKNDLLKTVIEKIVYDRNGDNPPTLEIYYK